MKFAPEYVNYVLTDHFEDAKAFFLSPLMAIHYAHLVMLAETGIVSRDDAHRLREALDAVGLDEVRDVRFDGRCEDLFFYVERRPRMGCRLPRRPRRGPARAESAKRAAVAVTIPGPD
jgi:argininosuccinate lyase